MTAPLRVLFVDDETRVLEALERVLFDLDNDWETRFVSGGEAFCGLFGGTVQKDQTTAGGGKAAFQAKGAPAPPACPALVEGCPSPP